MRDVTGLGHRPPGTSGAGTSRGPLPSNRGALLLLAAAVAMTAGVVASRAWVLIQAEVPVVRTVSAPVDPQLVRTGEHRLDSSDPHCLGASPEVADWRLGSRLTFHVSTATVARPPLTTDVLGSELTRSMGAFGGRPGPCGRGPFGTWASVGGSTALRAGIVQDEDGAMCAEPDGTSVVEWGPLPGPQLGLSCVFSRPDAGGLLRVVEADIRLDVDEAWVVGRRGCDAAYDVRSVLVHELGHVIGLDHPSVDADRSSSMSRAAVECSTAGRTLSGPDLVVLASLVP